MKAGPRTTLQGYSRLRVHSEGCHFSVWNRPKCAWSFVEGALARSRSPERIRCDVAFHALVSIRAHPANAPHIVQEALDVSEALGDLRLKDMARSVREAPCRCTQPGMLRGATGRCGACQARDVLLGDF